MNFPFTKSFNCMWHHFPKINCATDDMLVKPSFHLPQDLVMRCSWNWGCRHFLSSVCILVFGFVIFNLWLNADIYIIYTLTVWPGILARSKSHFWDHVLCWLTRRYCWSVWQGTPFLVSLLVIQRPVLLPRPDMASLGFLLLLLTCDHNCFNYKVHKLHKVHNIKYTNCETKDISHYAEISFIPHKNKSLCLLLLDYWY